MRSAVRTLTAGALASVGSASLWAGVRLSRVEELAPLNRVSGRWGDGCSCRLLKLCLKLTLIRWPKKSPNSWERADWHLLETLNKIPSSRLTLDNVNLSWKNEDRRALCERCTADWCSLLYRQELALAGYEFCISTLEEKIEREKELSEDTLSGRETWLFFGQLPFLPQRASLLGCGKGNRKVSELGEGKLLILEVVAVSKVSEGLELDTFFKWLDHWLLLFFLTPWWRLHNISVDFYYISSLENWGAEGEVFSLVSWFSYQSQR